MKRTIRTELVIETEEITVTQIGLLRALVTCPHCGGVVDTGIFRELDRQSPTPLAVEIEGGQCSEINSTDQLLKPTRRSRSA